nr:hypothetical protein [Tanacetum cinerariifolium]
REEKQIEEEQSVKAQSWKFPVCYDDDDDEEGYNYLNDNIISELPPYSAVTPTEPIDSLSIGDEHLDTIPATESDEFIKSCVENLVPNPSESEGENSSLSNEDVREKIYSNPLFDEEIIPMEIDSHSFNAKSDLIESLPNHDSSITISSKIDSLFDDDSHMEEIDLYFNPDDPMPPGIKEDDDDSERDIPVLEELLDNYSLSLPTNESYHFDISLLYRPPAEPPD